MAVSALATLAFWARPCSDMIDRTSEIEARHPEDNASRNVEHRRVEWAAGADAASARHERGLVCY
jgi:hypothetical protein